MESDMTLSVTTAAYLGQADKVEDLIICGSNPNEEAVVPRDIREREERTGDMLMDLRYIRYRKVKAKPIHFACKMGRTDVVSLLTDKYDVALETRDSVGNTPLFYAILFHHTDIVQTLTDRGADVNVEFHETSSTPLYLAVEERQFDIVRVILEAGADPNLCCGKLTPLMLAVWCSCVPIANLLISYGADPERSCFDDTPLQLALSMGNCEMLQYLLVDLQVSFHCTIKSPAFLMALNGGNPNVVSLLLSLMTAPQIVMEYHRSHPFVQRVVKSVNQKKRLLSNSSKTTFKTRRLFVHSLKTRCAVYIRLCLVKRGSLTTDTELLPLPRRLKDQIMDVYQRKDKPAEQCYFSRSSDLIDIDYLLTTQSE